MTRAVHVNCAAYFKGERIQFKRELERLIRHEPEHVVLASTTFMGSYVGHRWTPAEIAPGLQLHITGPAIPFPGKSWNAIVQVNGAGRVTIQ
jgi:hypothetical protein